MTGTGVMWCMKNGTDQLQMRYANAASVHELLHRDVQFQETRLTKDLARWTDMKKNTAWHNGFHMNKWTALLQMAAYAF